MRNAGLEEAQGGIKIAGRNINNLRYADDIILMADSEEQLWSDSRTLEFESTFKKYSQFGEKYSGLVDRRFILYNNTLNKHASVDHIIVQFFSQIKRISTVVL